MISRHSGRLARAVLCLPFIWCGATSAAEYSEAPSLAEAVKAGRLPPVVSRLPEKPLVVKPLEKVGKYGGTWRQAVIGGSDDLMERTIGYTRLVRWNPEWTDVVPDVAEAFSVNAEGTEYTFKLRKGLKWSDGVPFSADDLMFWYQDVLMNKELTPSVPRWLTSDGTPVVVEKVDDVTVRFKFAGPQGMLPLHLATNWGADILAASAAHYLKPFHKKYNPDIDAAVRAAGATSWAALFQSKIATSATAADRWRDIKRPVLDPWMLSAGYSGTGQIVAVRNPYFFKVDTNGQQLPYMDRVTYDVMGDVQAVVLKAVNGELDMQAQRLGSIPTSIVLAANRDRSGYRLFKAQPAWSNAMLINLNQTVKNPALREVFRNKDFRIGLSLAIDREELNEIVYSGQARPYQAAPRPGTKLYTEAMATQHTKFDVAAANAALDRAGYSKRDAQGFRLGPDGVRIAFSIDVQTQWKYMVDALELITKYWKAVGIDMKARPMEGSFAVARMISNDHEVMTWIGGGGYDFLGLIDPKWYFPYENQSAFGSAWGIWYQNAKAPNAEEPLASGKKQQELYTRMLRTTGIDNQAELMRQILEIAREEFYVIGTNMQPDDYGVVKKNMRNVPDLMPNTAFYMTPGPTNPEQYFYE